MATNLGGLTGAALGGAVGYGVGHYLSTIGQDNASAFAWGALAGCFTASMFGLLYDRTPVAEFRRSYKLLTKHLANGALDDEYDPRERIALLAIPVAFATIIIPVVAMLFAGIAWKSNDPGMKAFWTPYFLASIAAAVMTFVIGRATVDHRLLQQEIAFNSTPTLEPTKPKVVIPRDQSEAPLTEADWANYRTRGRRDGFLVALGGAGLLAFNHFFLVVRSHQYSYKLLYGGAIFTVVGLFALGQPLIMYRHLPVAKHFPKSATLFLLLAIVAGGVAGWQLEMFYKG
jgi:hypothetical protein